MYFQKFAISKNQLQDMKRRNLFSNVPSDLVKVILDVYRYWETFRLWVFSLIYILFLKKELKNANIRIW